MIPLPKVILVKLLQKANESFPILVTLFGIMILVNPVQLLNEAYPMLVTLAGTVMLVRVELYEKA